MKCVYIYIYIFIVFLNKLIRTAESYELAEKVVWKKIMQSPGRLEQEKLKR